MYTPACMVRQKPLPGQQGSYTLKRPLSHGDCSSLTPWNKYPLPPTPLPLSPSRPLVSEVGKRGTLLGGDVSCQSGNNTRDKLTLLYLV